RWTHMTHTGRTRTLLQALARHPEGMTTPQLAQAIGEGWLPWRRALNKAGIAMREHERLGRAARAGTVPGQRGHAVIWQITPVLATSLFGDLAARLYEDASAPLHEHPGSPPVAQSCASCCRLGGSARWR